MTGERRYAWTLGALNGAVVVSVIVLVYSFLSGWMFHMVALLLAGPFALVAAWRGAGFVRRLRSGREQPFRGPMERFVLMFGVTALYLDTTSLRPTSRAPNRKGGVGRFGACASPIRCSTA